MPEESVQERLEDLRHRPAARAALRAAGGVSCHLVGGLLRDAALGLLHRDVDLVVREQGRRIAERLARSLPARLVHLGGEQFASYRLVGRGATIDLWDRRRTSLAADLARRDFTVNAIALELRRGRIADPLGGIEDLRRRRLRAAGASSFAADPARVLRLARLAGQLPGFSVESETLRLAAAAAMRVGEVARERLRQEIELLLALPGAATGLDLLIRLDLYPGLWRGRPGRPGSSGGLRRMLTALQPMAARVEAALAGEDPGPDLAAARLALLVIGLAQPPRRPAAAGARDLESPPARRQETLRRMRRAGLVAGRQAKRIEPLLPWSRPPRGAAERRWFLHRTARLWPTAVCVAGAAEPDRGRREEWAAAAAALLELARADGAAIFAPEPLLRGDEAASLLGIAPGPRLGEALAALRRAQIEGRVRDRRQAAAWLASGLKRSSGAD